MAAWLTVLSWSLARPSHHAAIHTEQVTGKEAVRHQDAGALQMQAAARASVQNIHHAAADVADIDAALPDVLIIDVFQAARKNLLGALDGGSPARTGGDIVTDLVREGLVLQQGDLEQQNIRIRPLARWLKRRSSSLASTTATS